MKKKHIYIALLGLLFLSSCKKDWFDIKTDDSLTVPATLKDFQALLDNGLMATSAELGEIVSDGHFITDAGNDQLDASHQSTYLWKSELPYTISKTTWGNCFTNIYYCNLVLDGLKKIKENNLTGGNIKGQALFQRARNFYELAQIFAPYYQSGVSDSELGIPLRLEADANLPSNRSTLKEAYEQIIGDLLIAKDLMQDLPQYKTRGSKAAALGYLARIYLSMEKYEEAGKYADECLKIYSFLMDYNTLDPNASQSITGFNNEIILVAGMSGSYTLEPGIMFISPELINKYGIGDLRKNIFFKEVSNGIYSYKGSYSGTPYNLFSGLAVDELYLIRAESFARAGKTAEAMKDLNTLLVKRYKPGFVPHTATDSEDALRQILDEREKELLLRGLRWSDLRRLNQDVRFRRTLSRTIQGKTYTLEPNNDHYTLPIPDEVIKRTGMAQNKAWK
jgi:tetratricopeptide (TPR) repeat protein